MDKKLIKLSRTLKEGLRHFYKNGLLTFATVSVMTLALFVLSTVFLVGVSARKVLGDIEKQISISLYFNPEVPESRVNEIQGTVEKMPEVASVSYESRDQALDNLVASKGNDPAISEALEILGDNPLLSSLKIEAVSPEKYAAINEAIKQSDFMGEINRMNYDQNKKSIDNFGKIIRLMERVGIAAGIVFLAIAVLITFNAIRITLYSHRSEFEVMRLVGASNIYIRMPFVFEGIFYGLASAVSAMIILFIATKSLASSISRFIIQDTNIVSFYYQYFWIMLGGLLVFGAALGMASSFVAIRRYLKV